MRTIALALVFALASSATNAAEALPLDELHLPPGFHIAQFARVPNAREMTLGANGTVFVGSMSAGKVYALTSSTDGTHADKVRIVAQG
ncbi:MAG TPA: sorbosone dehydrogenase family protein, partial [Rudaea sp.]|nr:sorbosone dehydrogenase family protein [Rudaea sp.]